MSVCVCGWVTEVSSPSAPRGVWNEVGVLFLAGLAGSYLLGRLAAGPADGTSSLAYRNLPNGLHPCSVGSLFGGIV